MASEPASLNPPCLCRTRDGRGRYLLTGFRRTMTWSSVAEAWRIRPPPAGFPGRGEEPDVRDCQPEILALEGQEQLRVRTLLARLSLGGDTGQSSFHAANTIFKAYQYRPLLRYLSNPTGRILIADETGLGKTIETGYIILEELSRRPLPRILVLCPANLMLKWRWELWWRFGLAFDIASGREFLRRLPAEEGGFHLIVSIDAMRNRTTELESALEAPGQIDLLVLDEVHHAIGRAGETLRREYALLCSLTASHVVALSATPILLAAEDLKRVLQVVDPVRFEPRFADYALRLNAAIVEASNLFDSVPAHRRQVSVSDVCRSLKNLGEEPIAGEVGLRDKIQTVVRMLSQKQGADQSGRQALETRDLIRSLSPLAEVLNRTRRVEVGENRERNIRDRLVRLSRTKRSAFQAGERVSISEQQAFSEVEEVFRTQFSHNHVRQLASCLPGAAELLRLGAMGHRSWDDIVDDEGEAEDSGRHMPSEDERERCAQLYARVRLLEGDSKWRALVEEVEHLREHDGVNKFVVFTHWRPTLEYFERMACNLAGFAAFFVSGKTSSVQRFQTLRKFERMEGAAVLFATDVMAEGIDITSARCVVNYDLPYNPQVIEQRIGRIDRVGQKAGKVFVLNIVVAGSTDQHVMRVLSQRIGWSEEQLGQAAAIFPYQQAELTEEELDRYTMELAEYRKALEEDVKITLMHEQPDVLGPRLDEEIAGIESSGSWVGPEERASLMSLFLGIATEGAANLSRPSPTSVSMTQATPGLDLALARMAGERYLAEVRSQIRYVLDSGTKLTMRSTEDGVFLPSAHPLFRSVVEVLRRSMPTNPCQIAASGSLPGLKSGSYSALLSHVAFAGEFARRSCFSIVWIRDGDNAQGSLTTNNPLRWLGDVKSDESGFEMQTSCVELLSASASDYSARLVESWRMVERDSTVEKCRRELERALRRAEIYAETNRGLDGEADRDSESAEIAGLRETLERLRTAPNDQFGAGETVILAFLRIDAK